MLSTLLSSLQLTWCHSAKHMELGTASLILQEKGGILKIANLYMYAKCTWTGCFWGKWLMHFQVTDCT